MDIQVYKEKIDKVTEVLYRLLSGEIPGRIDVSGYAEDEMRQLCEMVNKLRDSLSEVKDVIIPLAQGNLDIDIGAKNFLASPFRQLQSNLRHLTWQVEQIAAGDFNQRVDFMGDFSRAFNAMVIALDKAQREITEKNAELKKERDSLKAMNTLMTGRELRMIELKKEINSLLKEQGRPGKY